MSLSVALRHRAGAFSLDAAFEVPARGVTAIFGPSGAGKTTIVQAIAGLVHPLEGRVVIDGRVVLDTSESVDIPAHRRRIGYVFQDGRLFPHMSVARNLLFGWRRSSVRVPQPEIDRVIALLGLEPLLPRRPAKLSGGEKGRVALARALLSGPSLLLLDEPLAALDAARKAEILPYLERLRDESGVTMLYVSHAPDEVLRLSNRVVLLEAGRVRAEGSVFDFAAGDMSDSMVHAHGAVLDTRIKTHRDDGVSVLSFGGGELIVTKLSRAEGTSVRVRIHAADVLLAREEPRQISANNILRVTVSAIQLAGDGQADIHLRCGPQKLTARITESSCNRLDLKPAEALFAIVKSVTVDPEISG